MAELKTKPNKQSVEEFLNSIEDKEKQKDAREICKMMREVSGHQPIMWGSSIIGFGTYTYKYASGREGEWMVMGFSPRKANLTIYIMEGYEGHQSLLDKLGPHSIGKSCLYIKRLSDIDTKVLKVLVRNSYDYFKDRKFRLEF